MCAMMSYTDFWLKVTREHVRSPEDSVILSKSVDLGSHMPVTSNL